MTVNEPVPGVQDPDFGLTVKLLTAVPPTLRDTVDAWTSGEKMVCVIVSVTPLASAVADVGLMLNP